MAHVFISHSSDDNDETNNFYKSLKDYGINSIFLDFDKKKGILLGENWEKVLYKNIKDAKVIILLLSPSWCSSRWCFAEYTQARALGKDIYPIIIKQGDNKAVDKWVIDNLVQKCDLTNDPNEIHNALDVIKNNLLNSVFDWDEKRSPYPGMISYEETDAHVFFGREDDIKKIVEQLKSMKNRASSKFINIIAASGMGKSSLLKAGIIPNLKKSYSNEWTEFFVMRPTQEPLAELVSFLCNVLGKESYAEELYDDLKSESYAESIKKIFRFNKLEKKLILLSIDQAEELYSVSDKEEKKFFMRAVSFLLEEREEFFMLWTLRSDFLKMFQTDTEAEVLRNTLNPYILSPIKNENIVDIIRKPAKIAKISIDNKLVDRLKNDIKTTDALPLLALCLNKLYMQKELSIQKQDRELSIDDYQALAPNSINPLEEIIQNIANESILHFSDNEKEILKKCFIPHMVNVNNQNEYIKKEAQWEDMPTEAYSILESLVKARLLIKQNKDDVITIEIAHEALIRNWSLLKSWIEEEYEFLLGKSQLVIHLKEWEEASDDEKNKALLNGLRLQKAAVWLDQNDTYLSKEEKKFIQKSINYSQEQEKKFEDLYNIAQDEVEKAKHNIGLVFVEKASQAYDEKDFRKAVGYSYGALENLNSMLDETEARMTVKKILINSPFHRIAVNIETNHSCIDILEEKDLIVTGNRKGEIELWSLFDGSHIDTFVGFDETIVYITLIQNGTKIISTSLNGIIQVWDVKNKILLYTISDRLTAHPDFLVSNDETKIIYSSEDFVFVKNIKNGQLIDKYLFKDFSSYQSFMYDEKNIFMYSGDTVKLFDITTGEIKDLKETYEWVEEHGVIRQIKHSNGSFKNMKDNIIITLTKDKEKIIALNNSNTIQVWDIKTRDETYVCFLKKLNIRGKIIDFYIMNSTRNVVLYTSDGSITLSKWDGTLINRIMQGNGSDQNFGELFVTKDEKTLIVSNYKKTINIFDLSSTKDFVNEISIKDKVLSLTYSTADISLYLNTNYTNSNLIDLNNNKVLYSHDQSDPVMLLDTNIKIVENNSCEELPNDTLQVINIETNEILGILSHEDMLFDYILSDDKKILISSSLDETIKVWDMENYALIRTISADLEHNLVLTKDNKYIFSTSSGYSICKWDIEKGEQVLWTLEGQIKSLALSTDNTKIVSVTNDKLKIWSAYNLELLYEMSINKSQGDGVVLLDNNILALYSKSDNLIEIIDIEQLEHLNNKDYIDYTSSLYQEMSLMSLKGIELCSWSKWTKKALWSKSHPFHWLDKAENGDPEAMCHLGIIYDRDNDNDKALGWYIKARNAGSVEAGERVEFLEKWLINNPINPQ